MITRPVIIFDTSGINRLADDADSKHLLAGLTSGFVCRLTGSSIDEIVATLSFDRRRKLLGICRRLLSAGDCICPHQVLLETLLSQQHSRATAFDWRAINVTFPDYEVEIARQEIIGDELAREQKANLFSSEREFVKIFENARPRFDELFNAGAQHRSPSFREMLMALQVRDGAFWSFGAGLCESVTKSRPDEQTVRRMIDECPPF